MKLQLQRIASSVLLIGILLFAQLAVNFFHQNHDIHKLKSASSITLNGRAEAHLQSHDGDHCKVCAIDFFNQSFVANGEVYFEPVFFLNQLTQVNRSYFYVGVDFSLARAPPFFL